MCKYRINQHLIVLDLYSVSINKIIVTEFFQVHRTKIDEKCVITVKSTT